LVKSSISAGRHNDALAAADELRGTGAAWEEARALLAASPPVVICQVCGEPKSVRLSDVTANYVSHCQTCAEVAAATREHQEAVERRRVQRWMEGNSEQMMAKAGVYKIYQSAKMADFHPHTLAPGSYYLHGTPGVGKTHMAVALMREWMIQHPIRDNGHWMPPSGRFWTVPRLLGYLKSTFGKGGGEGPKESDIIERLISLDILILDDLGAEHSGDWASTVIYNVVDGRYGEGRPIIVTSNITLDEVSKRLHDRMASRLTGMCRTLHIEGPDRRLQQQEEQR
jgi:DNA replication protein DnaC